MRHDGGFGNSQLRAESESMAQQGKATGLGRLHQAASVAGQFQRERPGIVLNAVAAMSGKIVGRAFPVPQVYSAIPTGSQMTSGCSGRGRRFRVA
jgi:hypothetical protein